MRCLSQSQVAWGEGGSAASRVGGCGLRGIYTHRTTLNVRCSRWVLEFIKGQRSEITGQSGECAAMRNPTRDAIRSSLAPCKVELKDAPHGERAGVRGSLLPRFANRSYAPVSSMRGS
jgi:hypothetical protein